MADIQPTGVLIYGCIAERCVLALEADGMVGGEIALVDGEVRVGLVFSQRDL